MSSNREVKATTRDLFAASERGDANAVATLVKAPDVDLNWHCQQAYGATALLVAITNGFPDVVQLLIDAGAELGALKTPDRNSPLHEAAFRADPTIMRMILERIEQNGNQPIASLIDMQNQFGNTPLHNAARTGSPECVEILLKADAKPSIVNVNGSLPLHHACYCEKSNLQVVKLLVDAGLDINHQDAQGYTPMMVAAKKNQTEVIDYLRGRGADLKVKNQFGENALHFATLRENKGAMELLEE
ncbi:hypothetical protein Poli38472_013869 [Pythium oligandrum]|uniref:Uncharacterized protein n=1 Tax=Pythium oligandrum TaxID=41045 RepID=A0A8K1C2S5_PYTOL|nr:hypothetical protein Poli38472_013869 [Pythium oligandrum]|eukprot:TMW55107.1 hypothetical protein Poli38472_013869 [Pythium oligandrum]